MSYRAKFVIVFVGLILTIGMMSADVPNLIDYQGRLTDDSENPLDGSYSIVFSIYDVDTGGTAIWSETQGSIDVNDGLFQVTLGSSTSLPEDLFDDSDRWIGINVAGDGEMSPRTKIVSVPFALQSGTSTPDDDWTISGDDIYHENGNIGIGTNSPAEKLDVNGNLKVMGTASSGNTGIDLQIGGSSSGKGGTVYIKAGDAQSNYSSNHWGGDVEIKGGSGNNNSGGDIKIEGGTSSIWTQSTLPTNVDIYGGGIDGAPDIYGNSGLITVEGGKQLGSNSSNRSGGHILLLPGEADGSGISGNIGIGTINPEYKLDVFGNYGWHAPHKFKMRGDGEFSFDFQDGDGNDYWHIWDSAHSSILAVRNNGKVGIGTSDPSEKLDVNGNLKVLGTASSGNTGIDLQISGSSSGKGGKVYLKAGDAQSNWSSNHWGGDVEIKGGSGSNNSGGDVTIEGGTSSIWTQSTLPTNVNIYGGGIDGAPDIYSSSALITVQGGKQLGYNSSNRSGGNILLVPGEAEGSGISGNVGIGTTDPVRTLHINDYMRLEPVSDPPDIPDEGDIYYDSDDHKLKCFDGTNWQDCW